jgi:exonuclease SbcC
VKRLEEAIERAAALKRELAGHEKTLAVADDLAWALRADKFQAYVQEEALRALADDGSRRLEELAEGRYALTLSADGQDFEVIDRWNGDEARSVRTLSGGETFLASLALALALADTLPQIGAAAAVELDSVFLDEGFGSLDREALDRAAGALDALRAGGRMVCVVTHLPELAQRLPARIHVEKSETGSTVSLH